MYLICFAQFFGGLYPTAENLRPFSSPFFIHDLSPSL